MKIAKSKGMVAGSNFPSYGKQLNEMTEIYESLFTLFEDKSQAYGQNAIHELGLRGCFNDIHRKYMRLLAQVWNTPQEEWDFDAIYESVIDLTAYGAIMLMHIKLMKEGELETF